MNFEILLPFFLISFGLIISPGPDMLYVLSQSLSNGKKSGIILTFGLVSGILVHTTLVAFGIAALIRSSELLYLILKLFGACYLLYLAYQTFKGLKSKLNPTLKAPTKSPIQLYSTGFLMNVLNPKVLLFFLALFPAFIPDTIEHPVLWIYTLGILFMIEAFLVFSLVAIAASTIHNKLPLSNSKFKIGIQWFQIGLFITIAFFLVFESF